MRRIHIEKTINERMFLEEDMIEIYGDGPEKSAIIGNEYAYRDLGNEKVGTFNTATIFVSANYGYIHDMSIINDSGDSITHGQAIALYNDCKEALVENCHIISRQDTLFISPLPFKERIAGGFKGPRENAERIMTKQIYRHCIIKGDVDFIFGSGQAIFENCDIYSLKSGNRIGYVAAPSSYENYPGFQFRNCRFLSEGCDDDSVSLARPWREHGDAIFANCYSGPHIKKEFFSGWNQEYEKEQYARFRVIQKGKEMRNTQIEKYIDHYMESFHPYKDGRWCYEDGILMTAIYDMYKATKEQKYYDFVFKYYDSMVNSDGTIVNYRVDEYNIDNICSGTGLMMLYRDCKLSKFEGAIHLLRKQLELHPRTSEGSYWHKQIYPNQVWMDGIYMGLGFYAMYAKQFGDEEILKDIDKQLHTLDARLFAPEKNLYMHAYDETKSMQWADAETGRSPHCWSRACGWVSMAMNDIYEESHLEICKTIFNRLVDSLKPYLKDGMLQQVVEVDQNPNYKETSGSAMLAYGLLKAQQLQIRNEKQLGEEVLASIIRNEFDGQHLNGICRVAGLDNKRRNGSFDYYMSEDISSDEVKGVAPFIMAYALTIKD